MISAQNLQLLLSGNRRIIGFCVLSSFYFLVGCGPSKKVMGDRPEKEDKEVVTGEKPPASTPTKVDTIEWVEVPETRNPPIVYKGEPRKEKAEVYNVSILLPLKAGDYNNMNTNLGNERFIHFYAGMKLGMEDLESEGTSLNIKTIDTEGNSNTVKNEMGSIIGSDLVIGPYERSSIKAVADYCKEEEITMVSPWLASSSITVSNPYYIQLRPSIRDYYKKIVDEIKDNHPAEQVVILKNINGKEDSRVDYIQDYAKSLYRTSEKPYKEVGIHPDSLILSEFYMYDLFHPDKETIFIVQNFKFEEDDFVYNCLRKLSAVKGERSGMVYGLPILLEMDQMDFNLYKIMDVHIVRSKFVDVEDEEVRSFRDRFLNRYGALPSDEAYYGYDVMVYFGRALREHGPQFQFYLDDFPRLLSTDFDIVKVMKDGREEFDDVRDINYFINNNLEVVKIDGNYFKVLD